MFNGNFVRQAREIDPTSTGVKGKAKAILEENAPDLRPSRTINEYNAKTPPQIGPRGSAEAFAPSAKLERLSILVGWDTGRALKLCVTQL